MMDFSTFLAAAEDVTDKDDDLEVEEFARNKTKSLPLKIKSRNSSQPQSLEEEHEKKMKNTERSCSANEETRSSGSVAVKVFTGYLFFLTNIFFKFIKNVITEYLLFEEFCFN